MAIVTKDTKKGEVFTGKPKKVNWERIWTFSGGPFNAEGWPRKNIHTDLEFATACGLPSKVATSATQFQGYVVQLMIDLFGMEWLSYGTMDVKFIRIVNAGDTLLARAELQSKEIEDDVTTFTLNVDCENQRGEKVLVGLATGCTGWTGTFRSEEYNKRLANLRTLCEKLSIAETPQLEPFDYLVIPELNQQFLYAEEDFNSRYIEESETGPPIVHPALILSWSNDTRSPSYTTPSLESTQPMWATIHTRDETFFYNPARVGKKLKVTWTAVGSYEKRGRHYSTSEILVVDEDGMEIIRRLYYTTRVSQDHKFKE